MSEFQRRLAEKMNSKRMTIEVKVYDALKADSDKYKYDLARRLSEISRLKGQIKALAKISDMQEKEIKLLKACREYDASGKNRPEGYLITNYHTGERQSGKN